jgi:hypothetical protein
VHGLTSRSNSPSWISLRKIVPALAVDDALNFDDSELAQEVLQREREWSQLLLDVTGRAVSTLQLRDLSCASQQSSRA